MRLDARDKFPSGMEEYLAHYGWHFSKKMCDWVVSKMYKKSDSGEKEKVNALEKKDVDALLERYGITLENKNGYDVKDYVDDPDGYPELPFTRFYSDLIGKGIPVIWEDVI